MKLVADEGVDKQIAYALKDARFDVNGNVVKNGWWFIEIISLNMRC